jgi:hypothetical protein
MCVDARDDFGMASQMRELHGVSIEVLLHECKPHGLALLLLPSADSACPATNTPAKPDVHSMLADALQGNQRGL